MTIKVEELVHINAPLSVVELHYEQEANKSVPWASLPFDVLPYIYYRQAEGQVYFYYNPIGINWQKEMAGQYSNEELAITNIKEIFALVRNIIVNETAIENREDFLVFVSEIRQLWPWLNYMWWAIEYREKNGLDYSALIALRKETEYFTPGLLAVFRKSIGRIYPELAEFADFILLSEIESGSIPDTYTLEKRRQGYAYTDYKLFEDWDSLVKTYGIEVAVHADSKEVETLKGQTAYPGLVSGKIRVVSKREDVASFLEGEILLSSTTTPDYLPAMKKASAIISEHGGVICHAAITSRELKIPCVVGVKGAVAKLKDGDTVEVDADKGIIKIIN